MYGQFVDRHCRTLPGAKADRPFGPDTVVWKIGGKMFAAYTWGGRGVSLAVRDGVEAQRLIQAGQAESAPYLLRGGWILMAWENSTPDELRERITGSYERIRSHLPAEVELTLPPLDDETPH